MCGPFGLPGEPLQSPAKHGAAGTSLMASNPVSAPPCFRWLQQPLLMFRVVLVSCSGWEQRGAAAGERRGNVSCCERWECAGQWQGQLPYSERGPDQNKQQTAGMESRVPRQSQRKETGIVGTWQGVGPQLEATATTM